MLLQQSALDWAALADRYADASDQAGRCEAGASHADAARQAARDAAEATEDLDLSPTGYFEAPPDPDTLARVDQLIAAAQTHYSDTAASLREAAETVSPGDRATGVAILGLGAFFPNIFFTAADVATAGVFVPVHAAAVAKDVAQIEDIAEGPVEAIAAARAQLDLALGALDGAEVAYLDMQRARDPDGQASTDALETVRGWRSQLATDASTGDLYHDYLRLLELAEQVAGRIQSLQQRVAHDRNDTSAGAEALGTEIHDAEQTARERAEEARQQAETALAACNQAVGWSQDDPLRVEPGYDQDLPAGDGGYTPPGAPGDHGPPPGYTPPPGP